MFFKNFYDFCIFQLPVVQTEDLTDYPTLRHLHLIFAFITNAYVWQNGEQDVPKVRLKFQRGHF